MKRLTVIFFLSTSLPSFATIWPETVITDFSKCKVEGEPDTAFIKGNQADCPGFCEIDVSCLINNETKLLTFHCATTKENVCPDYITCAKDDRVKVGYAKMSKPNKHFQKK